MYFAALGQFQRRSIAEPRDGDGLVIITASSSAGMLDIHDRRPLVLSAMCAAHWLDPSLGRGDCARADEFDWFPVSAAVGNVRNESAHLI